MAIWTLQQSRAALHHCDLEAELDLTRPADGLTTLRLAGQPMTDSAILGVAIEPTAAEAIDAYVRVSDLVATYPETARRPARVQIYWRASQQQSAGECCLDMQVSVQTDMLGVPTPIETTSRIAAAEVWRLIDAASATFAPLDTTSGQLAIGPVDGPGCLLFRTASSDWSYAEMIHPADFRQDALISAGQAGVVLQHRLFPDPLEKGVILRSQLRACWLRRDGDQLRAAALYRALLELPPPLTT